MTEEQIKQSIAQGEQDAITLDYAKWSAQQIQMKRSNDHGLWQQERDRVLRRQQSDNREAKRRRLAAIEQDKQDRQRDLNIELDRKLEPQKKILMREWFAANPGRTERDFETLAWVYLRQNLVEKMQQSAAQAETQALLNTGRYSL